MTTFQRTQHVTRNAIYRQRWRCAIVREVHAANDFDAQTGRIDLLGPALEVSCVKCHVPGSDRSRSFGPQNPKAGSRNQPDLFLRIIKIGISIQRTGNRTRQIGLARPFRAFVINKLQTQWRSTSQAQWRPKATPVILFLPARDRPLSVQRRGLNKVRALDDAMRACDCIGRFR